MGTKRSRSSGLHERRHGSAEVGGDHRPPSEVLRAFAEFAPSLQAALGVRSEVVLHDLARLPNSIVAISGDVTGRRIGDPATDVLLRHVRERRPGSLINYHTEGPDGHQLRSSTLLIRDPAGDPIGALCINTDVSDWLAVKDLVDSVVADARPRAWPAARAPKLPASEVPPTGERFTHSVEDLAAYLIERAIADVDIDVDLMKKKHKVEVVRTLEERGLFVIRDAVEATAAALKVSRFTIYNYLNEISAQPQRKPPPAE